MNNNIVAEIMNIVKTTKNNIDREDKLRKYFEAKMCEWVRQALEAIDRELAAQYGKEGWHVERRDNRTVQMTYGTISIKRRRMCKDGEAGIYPLDKELGIRRYQRYSAYFEYHVAQIAAKTVYRTTALAVNTLTPADISHQQVGNIVKHVGEKYAEWEKEQQQDECGHVQELKTPEMLYIEGDGLEIKGQKGKHMEVHRFQIAEGVTEHKNRRELVGAHYISDFEHRKAVKAMTDYLSMHYDLSKTIVMSNSDGGSGYTAQVFEEILGRTKRHEHFRDKYHVNKKIKDRIAWAGKDLISELHKALRTHDWDQVSTVLDTVLSQAQDEGQSEHTERLRSYLQRNWDYLRNMKQRGLEAYEKLIGTCESNHRLYSYRMKKQGRRWGETGGLGMVKILTGIKNGDLRLALAAREEYFEHAPSENFRGAVRQALKKAKQCLHEGVMHGRIYLDAPSSSPIGKLAKVIA